MPNKVNTKLFEEKMHTFICSDFIRHIKAEMKYHRFQVRDQNYVLVEVCVWRGRLMLLLLCAYRQVNSNICYESGPFFASLHDNRNAIFAPIVALPAFLCVTGGWSCAGTLPLIHHPAPVTKNAPILHFIVEIEIAANILLVFSSYKCHTEIAWNIWNKWNLK